MTKIAGSQERDRELFSRPSKKPKGVVTMKVGSLGQALLKAFVVDFDEYDGKARTSVPSCIAIIQQRIKPIEWEVARCRGRKIRELHRQNHKKAIETYRRLFIYLNRKKRWLKRRLKSVENVVEEIDRKLKENPTDPTLMRKYQYWLNKQSQLQKHIEYLTQELRKFVIFLKKFKKLHPIQWALWEDVGRSKGTPPKRIAQPEEYSDIQGFSIHYLYEYYEY